MGYYKSSNGLCIYRDYDENGTLLSIKTVTADGDEWFHRLNRNIIKDKDEWIQKAKALLFDISLLDPYATFRKEASDLLEEAGGYDSRAESSVTELKWEKL